MSAQAPAIPGVPRGVVLAAAAATAGALPVLAGFSQTPLPTGALFCAGWPALGLTAAVLLDRDRGSRVGAALAVFAAVPAALVVAGTVALDSEEQWARLAVLGESTALVLLLAMLVAVGWAVGMPDTRMTRRRLVWLVTWSSLLLAGVTAASMLGPPRTLAMVMTLGIWAFAAVVLRLTTTEAFRPVDEPLVDAAVPAAALLLGAVVAFAVHAAGARVDVPMLEFSAGFAAVLAAVLALPACLWLRRAHLRRRYGPGALSPEDMVTVTADLHPDTQPHDLLGRAAKMVEAATGHREARLLLGGEPVDPPADWVAYPLDVGSERAGVLLVLPSNPEGPEPHQDRVVRRMLPTIALMTRAVDLAAQADLAQRDLTRQRDRERTRILGDLHDGVGPQLAGLSMALQAELRTSPTPLLRTLAEGLADARTDLRRIVSGLTPSALEHSDLTGALADLADSFDSPQTRVELDADVSVAPDPEVAVAVYRTVAEGVSNALRHGRADHVSVRVRADEEGGVRVDVRDDGAGGPITPGVGLTSLLRRARSLGGDLSVGPNPPTGVHLRVELPAGGRP